MHHKIPALVLTGIIIVAVIVIAGIIGAFLVYRSSSKSRFYDESEDDQDDDF